ncbi:MAG: hypothetical protein AAF677_00890 [Pseudomonadota bacterium]
MRLPALARAAAIALACAALPPGAEAQGSPATPVERTLRGAVKCTVDLPQELEATAVEKDTWQRLCRGEFVQLNRGDPERGLLCNPAKIEGKVPENRRLRPQFLSLILTHPRYTTALARTQVRISCALIAGELDLENEHITPELGLFDSHLSQGANLLRTRFDRSLFLQASTVEGTLVAAGLRVGGDLFLSGTTFDTVSLEGAQIRGDVEATRTFKGFFDASRLRVGGNLSLREGIARDGVELNSAQIGGHLDATWSGFIGLFNADSLRVDGSLFLRDGSSFEDVNLNGAQIGGMLQLQDSTFSGQIDLTGSMIGAELMLSLGWMRAPKWKDGAALVLRNVRVDALQAEMGAWFLDGAERTPLPTDLTGFTYGRLGGLLADDAAAANDGGSVNMADATAAQLIAWIEAQPDHDARYDPQPYEQLAAALDAAGAEAVARRIRYAKFEHKRKAGNIGTGETLLLWGSRLTIGHGLYPFRLLAWFAALIAAGMLVAWRSRVAELPGFWPKLWYSLENALPLIELKPAFQAIRHPPWAESLFHAQKVVGFVLATILVGALTLLGG